MFDDFSGETTVKKEQKKVKIFSKQNSVSQRWRYRSGYTLPSPQKTVRAVSVGRSGSVLQESKPSGNSH
jgi:hypothetical protein